MSQKYATRAELLARNKRRFRDFLLPGELLVRIRSLTELEKSAFELSLLSKKPGSVDRDRMLEARQRLIVLCVVDHLGDTLFTADDVVEIQKCDGQLTQQLYEACREHAGFNETDLEELTKNSEGVLVDSQQSA